MTEHITTEILYRNTELLVCRKPAGLAVQAAAGYQTDLVSELKNRLSREHGQKSPYLGLIHRLDQPVEGLLVFALTKAAAADLSRQLTEGRLRKKYLAVLDGIPDDREGALVHYLRKDGRNGRAVVTDGPQAGAKRAELSYRTVVRRERQCLAEITIDTGRFHQIRAQMAHAGYPLAGDRKYGVPERTADSLALCAHRLSFYDRVSGRERRFSVWPQNPAFSAFREEMEAFLSAEENGGR